MINIKNKFFDDCLSKLVFLSPKKEELDNIFDSAKWKDYYLCNLISKQYWALKYNNNGNIWKVKDGRLEMSSISGRYLSFSFSSYTGSTLHSWDTYLEQWYLLHQDYFSEGDKEGKVVVEPQHLSKELINALLKGNFIVSDSFKRQILC